MLNLKPFILGALSKGSMFLTVDLYAPEYATEI